MYSYARWIFGTFLVGCLKFRVLHRDMKYARQLWGTNYDNFVFSSQLKNLVKLRYSVLASTFNWTWERFQKFSETSHLQESLVSRKSKFRRRFRCVVHLFLYQYIPLNSHTHPLIHRRTQTHTYPFTYIYLPFIYPWTHLPTHPSIHRHTYQLHTQPLAHTWYTYSHTHPPTHTPTYLLTHPPTYSHTHPPTHTPTHKPPNPCTHSLTYPPPPPHTHLSLTHPSIRPPTYQLIHSHTHLLFTHPSIYLPTHTLTRPLTNSSICVFLFEITYLQRLYIWQMAMCLSSSVGKKVSRQLPFSNAGSVSANVELTIPKYSDVFIAAPNKFQIRPGTVSIQLGTSDPKVVSGSLTPIHASTW